MPTCRWMWFSSVILLFVACELMIIFRSAPDFGYRAFLSIWDRPEPVAGSFYVWVSLLIGQAALWGYCSCLIREFAGQICKKLRTRPLLGNLPWHYKLALLGRIASLVAALVIWYFLTRSMASSWTPRQYRDVLDVRYPGVPGFLTAAFAVCCMWLVEIEVYCYLKPIAPLSALHIRRFLWLQDRLQRLLLITSIILALGTLSIDRTRIFVQAADSNARLPQDLVLIFGGVFSLLLGMAYAAPFLALQDAGREIRKSLIPLFDAKVESIEAWGKHRRKLDDILHLEIHDWTNFAPGLGVIAPFATALISHLLGGKS